MNRKKTVIIIFSVLFMIIWALGGILFTVKIWENIKPDYHYLSTTDENINSIEDRLYHIRYFYNGDIVEFKVIGENSKNMVYNNYGYIKNIQFIQE